MSEYTDRIEKRLEQYQELDLDGLIGDLCALNVKLQKEREEIKEDINHIVDCFRHGKTIHVCGDAIFRLKEKLK